jgi:hypothetical protein
VTIVGFVWELGRGEGQEMGLLLESSGAGEMSEALRIPAIMSTVAGPMRTGRVLAMMIATFFGIAAAILSVGYVGKRLMVLVLKLTGGEVKGREKE